MTLDDSMGFILNGHAGSLANPGGRDNPSTTTSDPTPAAKGTDRDLAPKRKSSDTATKTVKWDKATAKNAMYGPDEILRREEPDQIKRPRKRVGKPKQDVPPDVVDLEPSDDPSSRSEVSLRGGSPVPK